MNQIDWMETIGVGMILIAYFCGSFKILSNESKTYFLLNAFGAGIACYASYLLVFWPFIILEGTWFLVSVAGLYKAYKNHQAEHFSS